MALIGTLGLAAAILAGCGGAGGDTTSDPGSAGESSSAAGDGAVDTAYPEKDITMIVPYAAGGASDLSARTLAAAMEEDLGVSIIVENRTGGAGSVGLSFLAGAAPDGYTIGYMPVETVMLGQQGYDINPDDYDFLGQIVSVPATIAVPANSPYQTLQDLIDAAVAAPDTITVGNSGAGSIWDATTRALGDASGTTFRLVPFDGGAPAVTAAVGSQIDAVVAGISETSQHHRDGTLRVLAVFTADPVDSLEGVQTATEQGIELVMGGWGLVGAPDGLPDDVVSVLNSAIESGVASESYQEVINNAGNIPVWIGHDEVSTFVDAEATRFAALLAE